MTHNEQKDSRIPRLFQALCLCLLLLAGLLPNLSTAAPGTNGESGRQRPVYEQDIFEHPFGPTIESAMQADDKEGFRWAILIPIVAIIFALGSPVVLIIALATLFYRAKLKRAKLQSENIMRLLEAGREVPIELLRGDDMEYTATNLRKGLKNIGLGSGLLIALSLLFEFSVGALGFILIGLGIAQLAVWKLADQKAETARPKD